MIEKTIYSQRAVLALAVGGLVEIEKVSVEEVADLYGRAVVGRVGNVVSVLSLTMGGAERSVEGTSSEDAATHESVVTFVVKGSVDGSVAEVLSRGEAFGYSKSVVHVAVGASNNNPSDR